VLPVTEAYETRNLSKARAGLAARINAASQQLIVTTETRMPTQDCNGPSLQCLQCECDSKHRTRCLPRRHFASMRPNVFGYLAHPSRFEQFTEDRETRMLRSFKIQIGDEVLSVNALDEKKGY